MGLAMSIDIAYVRMVFSPLFSFFKKTPVGNAKAHDNQMLFEGRRKEVGVNTKLE